MEVEEDVVHLLDCHSSIRSVIKNYEATETIDASDYETSEDTSRLSNVYDKNLCKDNKLLTDFINNCIHLDQTDGMESIINKVILPAYVKADTEYKQSKKFRKVITKALQRLNNDPDRKYSHISDIVETLKLHVSKAPIVKKRVNLVTLSTKVSGKFNEHNSKRPIIESSSRVVPKKSKSEVIALDDDDIALDCDDHVVMPIDDKVKEGMVSDQVEETGCKPNTEKHSVFNGEIIEIQDSQELKIIEETQTVEEGSNYSINNFNDNEPIPNEEENKPTANDIEQEKENLGSSEHLNDGNMLLVPQKEKIVKLEKLKLKSKKEVAEMTDADKATRIKVIEAKIEKCKNTIAKLDQEEVTEDSANSPYYKCDRLRTLIVKLYKELCTLAGEKQPERRKIRLQISEGLPPGPIKRLEKFLNKQANEEGDLPFPDFRDVIRCVEKANEKDGLRWSKAKIMEEAQAIFSYCGRALQRRRQQREWKHLQAQVNPEEFEDDPAERDQALQARLEANRLLAKEREVEAFKRFTHLETLPAETASTNFQIEEEPSEEDSSTDEEAEPNSTQNFTAGETTILKESNDNDNFSDMCDDVSIVKEEPGEHIKIQYKGDINLVIDISDSDSEDDVVNQTLTS